MDSAEFVPFTPEDVVIHAEDEMFSRFVTHEVLSRLGNPRIVAATDGSSAEEALRTAAPEVKLVILDYQMPGRNGLQILRDLRCGRLGARRDIPAMMISAIDSSGLVAAAAALDIDGFALKPASVESMRAMLQLIFARPRDADALGSEAVYDGVDIDAIARMTPSPHRDGDRAKPVAVRHLAAGGVLARDVSAPNGVLLVAGGMTVTPRLVGLLRGLVAGGLPIEPIWIEGE